MHHMVECYYNVRWLWDRATTDKCNQTQMRIDTDAIVKTQEYNYLLELNQSRMSMWSSFDLFSSN
jgi:hypothetical protein